MKTGMKLWIYTVFVLIAMTVIVALLLKYTYEPTPEIVMKPSYFSQPDELGATILRRFYSPVVQKDLIVFGLVPGPDWQQGIVRGFINMAAHEKAPFDVLLVDAQMPAFNIAGLPPIDLQTIETNTETQAEFVDRVHALRAAGKRVILVAASVYSSHLVLSNPINRYEALTGEHWFSITTGPFALSNAQERIVDPPCLGSERDTHGTSALGCAYLKSARGYYSKALHSPDKYIAIMNSQGPNDQLLMVATPGQ